MVNIPFTNIELATYEEFSQLVADPTLTLALIIAWLTGFAVFIFIGLVTKWRNRKGKTTRLISQDNFALLMISWFVMGLMLLLIRFPIWLRIIS